MKILVTGAGGFIGANLCNYMQARGHDVRGMVHSYNERVDFIHGDVMLRVGDVGTPEDIRRVMRDTTPDWVFHCAMYGGNTGQDCVPEMFKVNVDGTVRMAQEAYRAGVKVFVNAGSSSEYGWDNHMHSEHTVARPNTAYGVTKLMGTDYISYMRMLNTGTSFVTLRLFSAYGPLERDTRFIPQLVRGALNNVLPPFGNPLAVRDFVYVDDVCEAFNLVASDTRGHLNVPSNTILNLGTGTQWTLSDAVDEVNTLFNVTDEPHWNTMPPRTTNLEPRQWQADAGKLKQWWGWQPRDLTHGVVAFAKWMRKNGQFVGC